MSNAFLELRQEIKVEQEEKDIDTDKETLVKEKLQLQKTLNTLSDEVEFLSKKNEQFLKELNKKNFYASYQQTLEEL